MADSQSNESPLDRVTERVDGVNSGAFELLGNETRLAILLALWEAEDPSQPVPELQSSALSFSELRDRVGVRDSGQFNYHLSKLEGLFVDKTEEGYSSTKAARQIIGSILAGTVKDEPSFEGEPLDIECHICGGPTVIDYKDRFLTRRCTNCDGTSETDVYPNGVLAHNYFPPVGLQNRTPQEFFRESLEWRRLRTISKIKGICLECSGTVTQSVYICTDHNPEAGTVCDQCKRRRHVEWVFTCERCGDSHHMPGFMPILPETPVVTFFYEHGVDLLNYESGDSATIENAIEQTEVQSTDPIEIGVTVAIDGDRLVVTLDEDANVIDVTEYLE